MQARVYAVHQPFFHLLIFSLLLHGRRLRAQLQLLTAYVNLYMAPFGYTNLLAGRE